jgi:hypothetical protein
VATETHTQHDHDFSRGIYIALPWGSGGRHGVESETIIQQTEVRRREQIKIVQLQQRMATIDGFMLFVKLNWTVIWLQTRLGCGRKRYTKKRKALRVRTRPKLPQIGEHFVFSFFWFPRRRGSFQD